MSFPPRAVALSLVLILMTVPAATAAVRWTDVTATAGIDVRNAGEVHPPDNLAWPGAPEIFGGGACWGDLDGDGYPDLYIVNARYNPYNPATEGWIDDVDPRDALYLNNGDGTFHDATDEAGISGRSVGYGCSFGDYDGDGDLDVFVAGFGDNVLLRNDGPTFTDVSEASGIAMTDGCGAYPCQSTSSAWADYDADGDLDLYVGNYVETHWNDTLRGPRDHIAQLNFLHRNNGDGTFTEVAQEAGVAGKHLDAWGSKTLGTVWSDFDRDGDLDLYVANDLTLNNYYENVGDGTFVEKGNATGTADHRTSMGVAANDYDNDGWPDLYFTHYGGSTNGFYRNLGNGTFEDRSGEDGQDAATGYVGWGAAFIDHDLDEDLDILLNNGHTEWQASAGHYGYDQPGQVIRNDPEPIPAGPGDRLWVDVTDQSGDFAKKKVWRGLAVADYDLDGDIDAVFVPNANQTSMLLAGENATNNWLRIELRQPGGNPHAVGAKVRIETPTAKQYHEIQAGSSYLSQNDMGLLVGLGANLRAALVHVTWPDGGATAFHNVTARQAIRIDRALGGYVNDTLAPRTALVPSVTSATGWWNDTVTAHLVPTDHSVTTPSGVAETTFATGDGPLVPYDGGALVFTAEGLHTVRASSTDHIGNREPVRALHAGIDRTPPLPGHHVEGTAGTGGWWTGPYVNITLSMDDTLSGAGAIRYRIDADEWTPYTSPFRIEEGGNHTVAFESRDLAGNVATDVFTVSLDVDPPLVSSLAPRQGALYLDGAESTGAETGPALLVATPSGDGLFRIRAAASDDTSGIERLNIAVDDALAATTTEPRLEVVWDLRAEGPGLHKVMASVRNHAGQYSAHTVGVLVVATAAPADALYPNAVIVGPRA